MKFEDKKEYKVKKKAIIGLTTSFVNILWRSGNAQLIRVTVIFKYSFQLNCFSSFYSKFLSVFFGLIHKNHLNVFCFTYSLVADYYQEYLFNCRY